MDRRRVCFGWERFIVAKVFHCPFCDYTAGTPKGDIGELFTYLQGHLRKKHAIEPALGVPGAAA
jgi:hypothetical protein